MSAELSAIIIEPSPVFREVLTSILESLGAEVTSFSSAELALESATPNLPDLVCMASLTLDLPARDAIERFRALAARRRLDALLITSTNEDSVLMDAWNQGFDGIVAKSRLDSLRDYVQTLIQTPRIPIRRLDGIRILCAEDGDLQVAVVRRIVTSEGGTLVAVPTAEEAWDLAMSERFDLILTDFHLEGILTGMGLIRRLKHSPVKGVPVIVVSGVASTDEIVRIYRAGADDFVRKPIIVEELLARILVWSGQTRS